MFTINDLICLFVLACCAVLLVVPSLFSKHPENYRTALGVTIVMICIIVGAKYVMTLGFWELLK